MACGLTGLDRSILYSVACVTGFRAEELASLSPVAFSIYSEPPTVTLNAENAKNGRTAVQPLPTDIVEALRGYLTGRPGDQPIWPGTWFQKAADMLRVDLDACGIPYVVEGPDGPLFADFHALRHSFIAMLDKSGATLKEAMQLARHSDPKLTMAVYGRAQLHDLGQTVGRLPSLTDGPVPESMKVTGTDGASDEKRHGHPVRFARRFAQTNDSGCEDMRGDNKECDGLAENTIGPNPLRLLGIGADCENMIPFEGSSPSRTRTYNKPVNSRLLYH